MTKYSIDQLIALQERGLMRPSEAARLLTGKKNVRTSAYSRFWQRHVERGLEKRIKRLKRPL
jgi:hypothetical protein